MRGARREIVSFKEANLFFQVTSLILFLSEGTKSTQNVNKIDSLTTVILTAIFTYTMAVVPISKTYLGDEIKYRFCEACGIGDISTVNKILRFKVSANVKDEFGASAIAKACAG